MCWRLLREEKEHLEVQGNKASLLSGAGHVAHLTFDKTMLQDVLAKIGEAFEAWSGGRTPGTLLLGTRAASVLGFMDNSRHLPLLQLLRSTDGVADADPRDCSGKTALRISQDSRAVEAVEARLRCTEGVVLRQRQRVH